MDINDVMVVMVNYKTYGLTRQAYESFVEFYPYIFVTLFDNGSKDRSTLYIKNLDTRHFVHGIDFPDNIGHGPAMDEVMNVVSWHRYIFMLDSDTETFKGGFLEKMLEYFKDEKVYAVGHVLYVNEKIAHTDKENGYPYTHPHAMMIDRKKYLGLHPFVNHGGPVARNMIDANKKGYKVVSFPIEDYVFHMSEGTFRTYNVPGEWQWK